MFNGEDAMPVAVMLKKGETIQVVPVGGEGWSTTVYTAKRDVTLRIDYFGPADKRTYRRELSLRRREG